MFKDLKLHFWSLKKIKVCYTEIRHTKDQIDSTALILHIANLIEVQSSKPLMVLPG